MKKFVIILLFLLLILFNSRNLFAQTRSSIHLITRIPTKDHVIKLRWAVDNAIAWQYGNEVGYILERYTITRDGVILTKPERKSFPVFKPTPINNWDTARLVKDQFALIMVQSVFGSTFKTSNSDTTNTQELRKKQDELNNRYGFGLYAADNCFWGACAMGWGFEDNTVQANEKYVYRIKIAKNSPKFSIDSAFVFTGLDQAEDLPKMVRPYAESGNLNVKLLWNIETLKDYYSSFYIERSIDSVNFFRRNKTPYTDLSEKEKKKIPSISFVDSLTSNDTTYYYRILGVNIFGELSPPSRFVKAKGYIQLEMAPYIIYHSYSKDTDVVLNWVFDSLNNPLVRKFKILKSNKSDGEYKVVLDSVSIDKRSVSIYGLDRINYYKISAIVKEGTNTVSYPYMVRPIDSLPPSIPNGIIATIDTNGVVTLKWNKNKESDLMGYKIFRSMRKEEEMVMLTDTFTNKNLFFDTLDLKFENPKAYYAISAIDQNYNLSKKSDTIAVTKPDKLPPAKPLITAYRVIGGSVRISWYNSSSVDVVKHQLMRTVSGQNKWSLVKEYTTKDTGYTDATLQSEIDYTYILYAYDGAGNRSESNPLSISAPPNAQGEVTITRFVAIPDLEKRVVDIKWDDKIPNIKEYWIYKAEVGKPLQSWKIIPATEKKKLVDTNVTPNTEYQYGIVAITNSGVYSKMKTISIKY